MSKHDLKVTILIENLKPNNMIDISNSEINVIDEIRKSLDDDGCYTDAHHVRYESAIKFMFGFVNSIVKILYNRKANKSKTALIKNEFIIKNNVTQISYKILLADKVDESDPAFNLNDVVFKRKVKSSFFKKK